MKHLLVFFVLIFAINNTSLACLNGESRFLKDGTYLYVDAKGNVPYGHYFFTGKFEEGIHTLDSLYKHTKDIEYLSDKGILLILLKRYQEARKLYLEIEKKHPNRYSTASNLGTAYELMGENENALKWIAKSVNLNPKSHFNSEWIHVNILEAKIKEEKFFATKFLLHTEFGEEEKPKTELSFAELSSLQAALYYQLNERVSFVEPKDKLVAQLLFDLGNIAFLLDNYTDALSDYKQAEKYGYSNSLLTLRRQLAQKCLDEPKVQRKVVAPMPSETIKDEASSWSGFLNYGILVFAALLIIGISWFVVKKRKKAKYTLY
ncbi:MAG: tetratricopeptide repeat protein [Bacteroidia bacterium]|nr:tetratricopeptide repeat protein [Bacteroidia bacterium]MCF8446077.1 tetratricopeptide repeat protein [Bacteroidia bacterium]